MATNNNRKVTIGVEYQLNQSKFNEIMSALEKIQLMTNSEYMSINKGLKTEEAKRQLEQLRPVITDIKMSLSKAFNTNIGTVNISKFNQELANSKLNINQAYKALQNYGTVGQIAFRQLATGLATQNLQLKESHSLLDKMSQTMANTVRYGISSSVFNTLTNRLQQSYEFSKQLNTSLNDIRIVTDKSADDMARFAVQANKAAKALGGTTQDYAKASLIYFQQGLSDEETEARTNVTLKAANVTGQKASDVSEQLTAVWNGYKVSAEETELYVDKLAKVAADTAADLNELSVGMSKVASAANNAGVDIDQMNAMLATVVSVTREAPETIGTSFRTLFARIGDLKLGATDEDGVGLGKVSSQLEAIGVKVLDQQGNMRQMGDIIEDLAKKWQTLTQAQQQAAAVAIGGKMQYSRLIALMNNWDMYTEALETSRNAQGTLQKQQDIYMDSTEAHLQQLQAAWEKLFIAIFDDKGFNGLIDGLTKIVGLLGDFTQAVGGGGKALATFGAIGMQVMSKQMTQGIATSIGNFRAGQENKKIISEEQAYIDSLGEFLQQHGDKDQVLAKAHDDIKKLAEAYRYLTAEEINEYKQNIATKVEFENENAIWEDKKQKILDYINTIMGFDDNVKFSFDDLLREDNFDKMTEALSNVDDQFDNLDEAIKIFEEHQEDVDIDAQQLAKDYENIVNIVKRLQDKGIDVFAGMKPDAKANLEKRFEKQSKDYINVMKNAKGKALANDVSQGLKTGIKSGRQDINDASSIIDKNAEHMDKMADKTRKANAALEEQRSKLQNLDAAETITKATTGITQLISAFNTLSNIPNILQNQDLNSWEKFTQITMALATGLPMLVTSFKNLVPVLIKMSPTLKAAAAANGELALSAATVKAAFFEIILPITLIIAAIAALIKLGSYLVKVYNQDAEAAKLAAEESERLKEAYETCNTAAKELKETISEYDDGVQALKNLTKGTDEYKKALEKATEQAEELIKKYDLVAGKDYTIDENGIVSFDTASGNSLERKQAELEAKADRMSYQSSSASAMAAVAAQRSRKTDFQRLTGVDYLSKKELANAAQSTLLALIPGIGPYLATGYRLGHLTSTNRGYNINDSELNELASAFEAEGVSFSTILGQSESSVENWIKNNNKLSDEVKADAKILAEHKGELSNWLTGLKETNNALKKYGEELIASGISSSAVLQDKVNDIVNNGGASEKLINQALASSEQGVVIQNVAASNLQYYEGKANKVTSSGKLEDFIKNNNLNGSIAGLGENISNTDMIRAYLKLALGYSDEDLSKMKIEDKGGKAQVSWSEASSDSFGNAHKAGEGILDDRSLEDIASKVAYQIADSKNKEQMDSLVESNLSYTADAINKMIQDTQEFSDNYKLNIGNIILNSMAGRDQKTGKMGSLDFTSAFEVLSDEKIESLIKLTPEGLAKALHMTEEDFANLGYKSMEAFERAFDEGLFEKERKALIELMNDVELYGQNSNKLTTGEFGRMSSYVSQQMTADQMSALSSQPLALSQINFNVKNFDSVTEKLKFMADAIKKANNEGIELTGEQKKQAEELKYSEKALKLYAEAIQKDTDALKNNDKAAVDLALANIQMNKGVKTLADNFEQWHKVLKDGNKMSGEYYEALSSLKDAAEEMFGLEVSADFLENADNLAKMKELAEGNVEVFDELHEAAMLDYVAHLAIIAPSQEETDTIRNSILDMVNDINSQSTIKFGTELDPSYVDQLNAMLEKGQITEQQMNQILGGIGYSPNVHYETKAGPKTVTRHTIKGSLFGGPEMVIGDVTDVSQSDIQVPVIEGGHNKKTGKVEGTGPTYIGKPSSKNINFSNTSAGKKSSGGGGSSSKPKEVDPYEKEVDRYHEIDAQIKNLDNDLQDLQKTQDKVFGIDKIKNLNKQYQLLNKQIDNQNKKLDIAKKEYDDLNSDLLKEGVTFGDDGLINNYETFINAKIAEFQALQEQYNNLSAAEQEKWDEDKILDDFKEKIEKIFEKMDRSDLLQTEFINSIKEAVDSLIEQKVAIQVETFNAEVNIRLNMQDAIKDWHKFKNEIIDNDNLFTLGNFEDNDFLKGVKQDLDYIKTYFNDEFSSLLDGQTLTGSNLVSTLTDHLGESLEKVKEAFSEDAVNGTYGSENTEKAVSDLQNYTSQAMDAARDIESSLNSIRTKYLNTFKKIAEIYDDQQRLYDNINKNHDHNIKLIELIYGDKQYDRINTYQKEQFRINLQQIDLLKEQENYWKQQMEAAEENSQEWEYAKQQWLSSLEAVDAKVEESVEKAAKVWETTIDGIIEKLDRDFTNGMGFEYNKEEWNLINKNADEYLDSINAAYGIQKLQKKYLDAIDNTTNVGNQRKLNKLMDEQVTALQQIDKLTQTDLDRAELKYQIALKEMELEEARNNKTSMRLRRDSQGNYSYQFVANDNDISKAREELDALKNQLYNFDLKAFRENLDKAAQAYEEYMQKLAEAAKIVDEEERAERIKLIQQQYQEYLTQLTGEYERYKVDLIESSTEEQIALFGKSKDEFLKMTDEEINKVMGDLVPQWNSGISQMIGRFATDEDSFKNKTKAAIKELESADESYRQDLTKVQTHAGEVFNNLGTSTKNYREQQLEPLLEKNDKLIEQYQAQAKEIRDNYLAEVGKLENAYQKLAEKIKAATDALIEYQRQAALAAAAKPPDENPEGTENKTPNTSVPKTTISSPSNSGSSSGKGANGVGKKEEEEEKSPPKEPSHAGAVDNFGYTRHHRWTGSEPLEAIREAYQRGWITKAEYEELIKIHNQNAARNAAQQKVSQTMSNKITLPSSLQPIRPKAYATGGYTGEWGHDGRLALLHQKELVLNAQDTSNFLNALEIMRNIVGNIGSDAFSRLAALSGNYNMGESTTAGIEQNVVINADFPNATDHNEIQQAFDNLMNIATQRVNRNRI